MPQMAVFFDRDGILNKSFLRDGIPTPPTHISEFELFPQVKEVCNHLKQQGFLLFVVTNQPDIARKKLLQESLDEMNNYLYHELPIDELFCCPHDDHHQCSCRKPKPGMILNAQKKWDVDLKKSFMIGDRWKDIAAGKTAGCQTIFMDHDYPEKKIASDFTITQLSQILTIIK